MCAEVNWRIQCFSRPKATTFCVAYRKDSEVDVQMVYISRFPPESLGGEGCFSSMKATSSRITKSIDGGGGVVADKVKVAF